MESNRVLRQLQKSTKAEAISKIFDSIIKGKYYDILIPVFKIII